MPAAVYSSFCRLLPWFLAVFSTVLAKILFAMAKTQPCRRKNNKSHEKLTNKQTIFQSNSSTTSC